MLKENKLSRIIDDPRVSQIEKLQQDVLDKALKIGATSAEVSAGISNSINVNVRMKSVESVEYNKQKGIDITIYVGKSQGSTSTTDFSEKSIEQAISAAYDIAKSVSEDKYSGLAEKNLLAMEYPDLDLYHPWDVSATELIEQAIDCESIALSHDERITNSEGVSINTSQAYYAYSNTNGFSGSYPSSKHTASCIVVAGTGNTMQRDYHYSTSRVIQDLENYKKIAEKAVEKTVSRINSRSISTRKAPVIFNNEVSSSLIGCLISAISGSSQYRESSFLLGSIDRKVFPSWVNIHEEPHRIRGLGSHPFDSDGLLTRDNIFVKDGLIKSYILDVYTGRRLNLPSTANGSGVSNLVVTDSSIGFSELVKKMDCGLIVTRLMGHGINIVTGDYSQGAAGYWVENGQIQFPVEEITIAGNLEKMFDSIVAIGNDINLNKNIRCGSILLPEMTIAGNS